VNYRHAFHAGNFADCFKHSLLLWLLGAMRQKPAGICVLDTHAGAGCYDLTGDAAARTGEWQGGIGRLRADPPPVLAAYVDRVREASAYPGSPMLIAALLREQDQLICCEKHPGEYQALKRLMRSDPKVSVHHRDAWEALPALLPPASGLRRGLVLIDPPYEAADEFARIATSLANACKRFPNAVYAVWYPIKHRAPLRGFFDSIRDTGIRDAVAAELHLRAPLDPARLNGCGLLVINPPWQFGEAANAITDALVTRLADGQAGSGSAMLRIADE
jgi:23S rRNA (adenine2030-N6)-methyltransferase